jgi:CcmD family protein
VSAGQYVAAAYAAVFVTLLAYVGIIAAKLVRLQREIADLLELARRRESPEASAAPPPAREPTRA